MPSNSTRAAIMLAVMLVIGLASLRGDETKENALREGFESDKTSWRREETDATVVIQAHDRSKRAAHEGQTSERFAFKAGPGSVLFYSQALPQVPISEKLRASLYVRANRAGVQLFGRIVLPDDLDPDTGRPSFVLVPGDTVTVADRWQRLELTDLPTSLERQARVLRVGSNRKVSLQGAYLERIVVNLYGGAGDTEVFLDELSVSPLPAAKPEAEDDDLPDAIEKPPLPGAGALPPTRVEPKDTGRVRLVGNMLLKDNVEWVPSVIYAPGADPMVLRQHGFDTMAFDADSPARAMEEAVRARLLLMPTLDLARDVSPEVIVAHADRFAYRDQVAFWNLGDALGDSRDVKKRRAELERVRQVVSGLRDLPEGRPRLAFGTIQDFLPQYALAGRNLDLLGIEATDWATIREPLETYRFLQQRREITAVKNAHAPFLAWVNAAAPPSASQNVWGFDDPPTWGRPQVQPEQIRQQVYAAISAGYRAIGFRADSEITRPSGEARLIEMAFLNAEMDLVESLIAKGSDPIQFWPTFSKDPEIPIVYNPLGNSGGLGQRTIATAKPLKETLPHAAIRTASIPTADKRGRLLLVVDYSAGSQYQPPQMAENELNVMVPVAENCIGLEITPASVQVLKSERTTGGRKFILPVFNGTALILVTTDLGMKARLEAEVAKIAPMATDLAIRQARLQIREAAEINGLLARDGHPARDADDLLRQANTILKAANDARERMDYALAWSEAQRVGRSLRVLKWRHYSKAYDQMFRLTRDLARVEEAKAPYPLLPSIASPPLTAFQTLPQHFIWMSWIRGERGGFGENLLPSGLFDFDGAEGLRDAGWENVSHEAEDVETKVELYPTFGYGGDNGALRLVVIPKDVDEKSIAKVIPFLDHPALAVRSPAIKVHKRCVYRIRFLVRLTRQLPPATGGIIVRDSLGGEPYQFRITDACPHWREVTLYRAAAEDGDMTITLGLAGYGEAWFDRLRVDTITEGASPTPSRPAINNTPIARRPTPPRANLPEPSDGNTLPRR
ncbi:MAG: hypothetical protein JWN86_2096 [Planctomycetota bacterium]|nr:hypothetical protein [Planctomycetota bacterium]